MIPELENAVLVTDLDMNGFDLLNPGEFSPVPPALLDINDARLSNSRAVTDGSVTNVSVSDTAGILQSKLSLDGTIPGAWLGVTSTQAAQGNFYQPVSQKGSSSGYCELDANGKLPLSRLPSTGPQSGTVTQVGLSMPVLFSVSGSPIKNSGSFSVSWVNASNNSWFGVHGLPVTPTFITKQIPLGIVPSLDAAKFTSGEFPVVQLPVAIGMGGSHAKGIAPDPGDGSKGMDSDYLGRDMQYHHFDADLSYQPTVPDVNIFIASYISPTEAYVTIRSSLTGSSLFYEDPYTSGFVRATTPVTDVHITIKLLVGDGVKAYASKSGYNNSPIDVFIVPPPQPSV